MRVVVGLSSGIGNTVFMLPLIRALHDLGAEVVAYVQGDYSEQVALWRRCRWLTDLVDGSIAPPPDAQHYIAGDWCPPRLLSVAGLRRYRYTNPPHYPEPEWSLALRAARDLGWQHSGLPDVISWCDVSRETTWDMGFVAGCKPGLWERKRYPFMGVVARHFAGLGLRCVQFGQSDDGESLGVDDQRGKWPLERLPDALASCRLVIGTDSGPTHLASSLGVPVVMLFTATSEVKGDPVGRPAIKLTNPVSCRPCQATTRWHACTEWACREIPVEQVIQAACTLLAECKVAA